MNFLEEYKISNDQTMTLLNKRQRRMLAIMCVERQFQSYKKMAKNKLWDRSGEYRQLLDCCWQAVLRDEDIKEELWEQHEKIRPEQVNQSVEEYQSREFSYANMFAGNVGDFLETLLDDIGNEETFRLVNFDYIFSFLNEEREGFLIKEYEKNSLILAEKKRQELDKKQLEEILCFDAAKKWYEQCESLI